jgi:hypothetical protein
MQAFTIRNVTEDQAGWDVGYWSTVIQTKKQRYVVSITRDGEGLFTISAFGLDKEIERSGSHIAGHVASIEEAVELANETATNLRKHDLYVTLGANGVGVRVLVKK